MRSVELALKFKHMHKTSSLAMWHMGNVRHQVLYRHNEALEIKTAKKLKIKKLRQKQLMVMMM